MKKILLSLSLAIFSLFVVSQVDVRSSIKGYVNDGSGPVEGAEAVSYTHLTLPTTPYV